MKLAIVLPRYVAGTAVTAGAERLGAALARRLAEHGHRVEVLTTRSLSLSSPSNELAGGAFDDGAVRVHRFPLDLAHWDGGRYRALTRLWSLGLLRSPADEAAWLESLPHAPALYDHLDRHQGDYDSLLFLPYIAPTTLYGAVTCLGRATLIPALHDEPFARMRVVRLLLSGARRVLFLSDAERELATRDLCIPLREGCVVGAGVDDGSAGASGGAFRGAHGVRGPMVLYAGRVEPSKNVHVLLRYADAFRARHPEHGDVTFVLRGTPGMYVAPRSNVRLIEPQRGERYWDAYAAADVLCQPSQMESFSLALMEGWLCGIPALVHAQCAVTREHVERCGGGLWFGDADEFCATLEWLLTHPQERAAMGRSGRRYVLERYNWAGVLSRVERALQG